MTGCPNADLQRWARGLSTSGALDWLQWVEQGIDAVLTLGTMPLAPAAFTIRWIADGCGPITSALKKQFAAYHDFILLEAAIWGIFAGSTTGAAAIASAGVGLPGVGLAAAVEGVLAGLAYLTSWLATGQWPGVAALTPLTVAGGSFAWFADLLGLDGQAGRRLMQQSEVTSALKSASKKVDAKKQQEPNPMVDTQHTGPFFNWAPGVQQPGGASGGIGSAFNAYSRAYQEAAAEAYAIDPNVDLRPWLAAQIPVDLAMLQARQPLTAIVAPVLAPRLAFAIAGLRAWQTAVMGEPGGPWAPSTVRRVLRSAELQKGLPVVTGGGEEGNEDGGGGSGGGGGGIALVGAAALALLFSR